MRFPREQRSVVWMGAKSVLLIITPIVWLGPPGCTQDFGPGPPVEACGDGRIDSEEACDDGNLFDGDGCSHLCTIEDGFLCFGQPSDCSDDQDGDGSPWDEDCDDNDPQRFPGNTEMPNDCQGTAGDRCGDDIDQDCDGVDTTCFPDADCDGASDEYDCEPHNPDVYPGQYEDCTNTWDDNCNDAINEGCVECDRDHDGYQREDPLLGCPDASYPASWPTDCDDLDSGVSPGITDGCGGQEGDPACAQRQLCDGVDNDCDGSVDEGCPPPSCDADGDGFSVVDTSCSVPPGMEDCDDANPMVYPGAPDICGDGLLQNCNVDLACDDDGDGDGYTSTFDCDDSDDQVHPWAPVLCNGIDDDCDGIIDEGCVPQSP